MGRRIDGPADVEAQLRHGLQDVGKAREVRRRVPARPEPTALVLSSHGWGKGALQGQVRAIVLKVRTPTKLSLMNGALAHPRRRSRSISILLPVSTSRLFLLQRRRSLYLRPNTSTGVSQSLIGYLLGILFIFTNLHEGIC